MSQPSLPTLSERASLKSTAIEAARIAGAILEDYARKGFRIDYKNAVNLVTDADRASEKAVVDYLTELYPSHEILAEEQGDYDRERSPYRWVIDPLDGTTNFAHGYPAYCVSIGLEYQQTPILGVVFDPTRQELFVAETGQGAYMNGQRLQVSVVNSLDHALLVTGFAYDIRETAHNNLDHFVRCTLKAQGVRRTGTAALDMCYVAAGRFDGFWELKLHPWDMAAGSVIVQEAGGRLTNFKGEPLSIYGQQLVATNHLIHDALLSVLAI